MIDTNIQDKLAAALDAEAEATNAHAQAALAVEQGAGSTADLTKANKTMEGAQKRVSDLRAALTAFQQSEAARIAEAHAAAQHAQQEALTKAIHDVRGIAAEFDQALDTLAIVSRNLAAAIDRAHPHQPSPTQVQQIERARGSILDVIQYQLRGVLSHGGPLELSVEKDRLSKLVNHLPQVNE